MRNFLLKIFGFAATAILFLMTYVMCIRSLHHFPPSNMYYPEDVEMAFDDGDIELVALGNSKLLASLDREMLGEKMNMKTAILGYNSSNISVSKLFLQSYLNHAVMMPKIVLMEVSWFTFSPVRTNFHSVSGDLLIRDFKLWKEIPRYYPDVLKHSLKRSGKQIHRVLTSPPPKNYTARRKAMPVVEKSYTFTIEDMEVIFPNHIAGIDSFLFADYQAIVDMCDTNGIQLILYSAPEDEKYSRAQIDREEVKAVYSTGQHLYLDYTLGGAYYDKKFELWMMDSHHLNAADLFTQVLVDDIHKLRN